mgnify:CR=1 FL=1
MESPSILGSAVKVTFSCFLKPKNRYIRLTKFSTSSALNAFERERSPIEMVAIFFYTGKSLNKIKKGPTRLSTELEFRN